MVSSFKHKTLETENLKFIILYKKVKEEDRNAYLVFFKKLHYVRVHYKPNSL